MEDKRTENRERQVLDCLASAEKVLVGIGGEWRKDRNPDIRQGYEALGRLLREKDYFLVTTNTDAAVFDSTLDGQRIVAPCGNETWRQCSRACTKDIWEPGEIPDERCPHCGAPLTGNTRNADEYIEEGYLPQWHKYTRWLTMTINRELLVLELGEGFQVPTVIRWPFEKTVYFNRKSRMYRVHESLSQVSEEIRDRAVPIGENSVEWVIGLEKLL
ncbi:MAG: hypothetical protein HFG75_15995 [Hungatella sp.]|nr:hypothetical protein [Hungatella sp.]